MQDRSCSYHSAIARVFSQFPEKISLDMMKKKIQAF